MTETAQINSSKKRTYDDHVTLMQISAMQFGEVFKSKTDFHGYWSQRLKVSPLHPLILDPGYRSGTVLLFRC